MKKNIKNVQNKIITSHNMGFAKERVKCKLQLLCFLSAKPFFICFEKCKLANKKMVLLPLVLS